MKNFKWLLVVLIVFIGFSCSKTVIEDTPDVPDELTGMESINVPDGFDWKMKTDYELVLTGGDSDVITITNMNGSRTIYQGSYIENENGSFLINLTLPAGYTSININSTEVSLNGDVINVDVSGLKSRSEFKADAAAYTYNAYTGTLAFEDLWPGIGDHDFNDIVIGYKIDVVADDGDNSVSYIDFIFTVKAHGAQLPNGFGFTLPGATFTKSEYTITGQGLAGDYGYVPSVDANGFENGHPTDTVVIIAYRNVDYLMAKFTNVNEGVDALQAAYAEVTIRLAPLNISTTNDLVAAFKLGNFNPFIYIDQHRGQELHLVNYAPTALASTTHAWWGFGTFDDDSSIADSRYYISYDGLPWALDIPGDFAWPFETRDIALAYNEFTAWVESDMTTNLTWYSGGTNASLIYTP